MKSQRYEQVIATRRSSSGGAGSVGVSSGGVVSWWWINGFWCWRAVIGGKTNVINDNRCCLLAIRLKEDSNFRHIRIRHKIGRLPPDTLSPTEISDHFPAWPRTAA